MASTARTAMVLAPVLVLCACHAPLSVDDPFFSVRGDRAREIAQTVEMSIAYGQAVERMRAACRAAWDHTSHASAVAASVPSGSCGELGRTHVPVSAAGPASVAYDRWRSGLEDKPAAGERPRRSASPP